jgi:dTDP-4-dehydrorhamnose 3,5-epimerase
MKCEDLPISGALRLRLRAFADRRGYFKETYTNERYRDAGITEAFVQDNVSLSNRGTLRGLHGDARMAKLVHVLVGEAFDVIVDARRGSPTYGKWHGEYLRGNEHVQLYIPAGCLHGFLSLADGTILSYKQSAVYDPTTEVGVAWNDPDIAIAWPLDGLTPLLSAKDARNPALAELP